MSVRTHIAVVDQDERIRCTCGLLVDKAGEYRQHIDSLHALAWRDAPGMFVFFFTRVPLGVLMLSFSFLGVAAYGTVMWGWSAWSFLASLLVYGLVCGALSEFGPRPPVNAAVWWDWVMRNDG